MNRIYQGRVGKVEIPNPGDKENLWQMLSINFQLSSINFSRPHHELFQGAVNFCQWLN
jgi:hypothetical protein